MERETELAGSFWGVPRTARSIAIAIAGRQRGQTLSVDDLEQIILEEVDAANVPPHIGVVLQAQILP